ncbi:MAG TPA: MlaD family protein [Holophaga sp.]|nr:MlaD family protein [Holophaga sp.]
MKLETKVGAFFLASLVVLGILIFRTQKIDFFGKKSERDFALEFKQVAGLTQQGKVLVAGVKVGSVQEIRLERSRARVVISVDPAVPIYSDASATLSSIGILGEKYVDLDPGHPESGPLANRSLIASKEGVGLDSLMETLAAIGKDVKGITQALNESIGGEAGRQKLDEIVDNIRVLTGEFRAMAQENHGAINETMANAAAVSAELRDRLPKLAQQFEDLGRNLNGMVNDTRPEVKGLVVDVRKLAQNFQTTSENIRSITDKVNKGEGTIGKLLNDEATVQKINTAVDNVNELLGGIKNMELRLDMGGAQWTKRGDSQTGLGIEIAPRKDYWYSIGLSSTPDGKISESTRASGAIDPVTGLPTGALDKTRFVTTDQAFTVSAEFAKRLGEHFVLHGGIIDGKGGAGAEYRAMDDRFRLGALAYDFTKRDDKPNPRYRVTSSFQFWKGLYVQAGVQDIGNRELRTFFAGGGIRWTDNDLKKLVGLAAGGSK